MGLNNVAVLLGAVFCLLGVESQIFNEGKLVRSSRQRDLNKRPHSSSISEDSYVVSNTKRPTYIEGGNQWKPIYNIPSRPNPSTKYRSKPNIYSSKYQQSSTIYPQEYRSKTSHAQSTANFIANQSLLVADITRPSSIKTSSSNKKSKYQYIPKNNYNNQQYEVHEEVEDDTPSYSTQNHYRYHDHPVVKNNKSTIKPSVQYSEIIELQKPIKPSAQYLEISGSERHVKPSTHYSEISGSGRHVKPSTHYSKVSGSEKRIKPSVQYTEMVGQEKHIHHVYYHDTMEEALKAYNAPKSNPNVKNFRGNPSRRPY